MPTSSDPSRAEAQRFESRLLARGRCLLIGEVAQAHDGSLAAAHAYVDAIADAGADGIKFQTHLAAAESTPREPWRKRFRTQDETRYDYWRRMEWPLRHWRELAEHARERGLFFLSSPFSVEAVELLEEVGVAAFKIASGEVSNLPLLERVLRSGRPILLSTGMSGWAEIDAAHALLRRGAGTLALLQCTSKYPTPLEEVGVGLLAELNNRYQCPVGLSDHSGTIWPGVVAATLGAKVVEVHVAFSREVFSPDLAVSLTTAELRQLAQGLDAVSRLAKLVDKEEVARELQPMRDLFTKSIVARRDLSPGHLLQAGDLAFKKPGFGMPPSALHEVIGRRLRRGLLADEPLAGPDLEPAPLPLSPEIS